MTEMFKGTVSVLSIDPPCKDVKAGFTMIPLKALSDQVWIRCKFNFEN